MMSCYKDIRLEFHSYLQTSYVSPKFHHEDEITVITSNDARISHTGLETSLFRCKNMKRKKQAGIDKLTIFLREIITIFATRFAAR